MQLPSLVNSLINEEEDLQIRFQDKLSLVFMIIGAVFLGMIAFAVVFNIFQFDQMEFETPF